ncbi:hypothetical protein H0H81_009505 [Sphagnurus paluster]|uniref:Homeobox domain-containing protein n=1 Tax=Sphagnurus paluster TaxID=117069 RepID=A0A9P7GSV6_9AGAR|nr:hypothetical protein H0H81_009505 [Sphagnurus paluster]
MAVPLSSTSSTASVDSSDDATPSADHPSIRRTRKRFTNDQLTMLETLFHQNSHPSRDDRDALAKLGGMETKSVTIWFQNKRQTERKVALNNATNSGHTHAHPTTPPMATTSSRTCRPSLDRVASRSELPMPPPRTPTRQRDPNATLWDNMPSSPIAPPRSPPLHEYVGSKRTLEWACAAARLSDRHGSASRPRRRSREKERARTQERERDKDRMRHRERPDWTDEETDEAITPPGTLAGGDIRWTMEPGGKMTTTAKPPRGAEDDDMMKAALTLCGLGRRP